MTVTHTAYISLKGSILLCFPQQHACLLCRVMVLSAHTTGSRVTLPTCSARCAVVAPHSSAALRPLLTRYDSLISTCMYMSFWFSHGSPLPRHAMSVKTSAKRQRGERSQRLQTRASTGEDSVKGAVGQPSDHQPLASSAGSAQVDYINTKLLASEVLLPTLPKEMDIYISGCRNLQSQQHQHLVSKACRIYQSTQRSL